MITNERAEAIQALYAKINPGRSIGADMEGTCGFSNTYLSIAQELNEALPEGMEEVDESEVGMVCENFEEVWECAQCGWYASEGEMEENSDGRICSSCVSENDENEEED